MSLGFSITSFSFPLSPSPGTLLGPSRDPPETRDGGGAAASHLFCGGGVMGWVSTRVHPPLVLPPLRAGRASEAR